VVAAGASWLRGGRYVHDDRTARNLEPARPSDAAALAEPRSGLEAIGSIGRGGGIDT